MKYGIIGTGAIGGFFGAKLAKSGQEVHFLFHRDYDVVCKQGLQVNSYDGDFHLFPVHAYQHAEDMPQCDVVLVALKSVNNELLKTLLPPLLKADTLVVMIQNGIGVEDDIQKMFPGTWLAAGLAYVCAAKTKPGVVDHLAQGSIDIGNYSCKDQNVMDKLISEMNAAGVKAKEVEYHKARWNKAIWNMSFNGMTVALDTKTDALLADPASNQLIRDLMLEVIDGARACGVKTLTHDLVDKIIHFTQDMPPYSPSMKLDYDFHRPMEIYYLYTRPIEEAKKAGYEMPKLSMLEAELKFKERNNL
ncbi:2-dehydropantoate 2-reductase [Prevotella cerevisiae]|uniref:2-dehydropantoate 2-reductase n=1 Tax=Segatella cerevisiae TaxID=2053716 RepID=A0ABT1BZC6_9BACT|nr:2-dehydropantoate 2-reductase [Segatella cerevisiae]MCO6026438.1 2-dehydropantoate 2-reductase [Segatella cerevisiae]